MMCACRRASHSAKCSSARNGERVPCDETWGYRDLAIHVQEHTPPMLVWPVDVSGHFS